MKRVTVVQARMGSTRLPGKTLVLVERTAHVPEAIRLKQCAPTSTQLLALAPGVMEALTEADVPFRIPEEFLSREALNQRGRENFSHLEHLGEWFDTVLNRLPESLRLNPVYVHFYRLKLLVDSVSLRVEELAAVFRVEKPHRIVVLTSLGDLLWAPLGDYTFITTDGPIYAGVAPLVAERFGLRVDVRRVWSFTPIRWGQLQQRACSSLLAIGGTWRWLSSWWDQRWRRRPTLWQIAEPAHDIPHLVEALSTQFVIVPWGSCWVTLSRSWVLLLLTQRETPRVVSALHDIWRSHRETLSQQPVFTVAGINYFSLLEPILRHLILVGQQETGRIERLARQLIRRHRPSAALGISSIYYPNTILSLALRAEGIPVVYAQEGGLYGYCRCAMYHYCELALCDYFIAYGPGAADYLNTTRLTLRQRALALPVGAIRLQRLQASARTGGQPVRRVMYVPTADFHHNLRYAPLNYSDRQYAQLKTMVLEALLTVPGIQVIYKPIAHTLGQDALRSFLARHAGRIVVCERPLTEVLAEADAFVLDWPTTSLLEVLTTRKPVAVLLDREVTEPLEAALPLLRRRARVSVDVPSFLQDLRRGFTEVTEDLNDTAFLDAFGTGGAAAWSPAHVQAFFSSLGEHGTTRDVQQRGLLVEVQQLAAYNDQR